jgi:hypothetical protein
MFSVWPGCSHRDALTFHGFAADRLTLPVLAFAGMLLTRVFARHRRVRRASPLIQAIGDHNVPTSSNFWPLERIRACAVEGTV